MNIVTTTMRCSRRQSRLQNETRKGRIAIRANSEIEVHSSSPASVSKRFSGLRDPAVDCGCLGEKSTRRISSWKRANRKDNDDARGSRNNPGRRPDAEATRKSPIFLAGALSPDPRVSHFDASAFE